MEQLTLRSRDPALPERLDYWFSVLCSLVYNTSMGRKDKAMTPEQFVPKWGELPAETKRRERTELVSSLRMAKDRVKKKRG